MRFDSVEHLEAWRDRGRYPVIHQAMQAMVLNFARESRFLDLCCSYGLLADYLGKAGFTAIGVDRDAAVLARARDAGIEAPLFELAIGRATIGEIMDLIDEHDVAGIVARRALPELFDRDLDLGREFFLRARGIGVREVFIEGRVATRNATSALASLDAEVELAAPAFREIRRVGNVAQLVANDAAE